MLIQTERFGALSVDEQALLSFDTPLIGFPQIQTYFLHEPVGDNTFVWLQASSDPCVALPMIEIEVVSPSYEIDLHRSDLIRLGTLSSQDEAIHSFAIVTLHSEPRAVTANLMAPIFIHRETRKAIQMIADSGEYDVDTEIFDALRQAASRGFFHKRRLNFGPSSVQRLSKNRVPSISSQFRRLDCDSITMTDEEPSIH